MTDPSFKQKLQALVEASTKGPWDVHVSKELDNVGGRDCAIVPKGTNHILAETFEVVAADTSYPNKANADLIVTLVNAAPAILELMEVAEDVLASLTYDQDSYDRNGPSFTSPAGNEYEETADVLNRSAERAEKLRNALSALEASNG